MEEFKGKQVLFKVAGDVYSAGDCHFELSEVFDSPLHLKVSNNTSALLAINKLFTGEDFDDDFFGLYSLLNEGDDNRINVLHCPDKNGESIPLDGKIRDLFMLPRYDFFIAGKNGTERFRMVSPNVETGFGRVLYKGEPLHRKVKIRNIFGESSYIELSHVGSPYVEFTPRTDYDVIKELEAKALREVVDCIIENFNFYKRDSLEGLSRDDLVFLHSLTHSSLPASSDDVLEGLYDAEWCTPTMCDCGRDSYLIEDVKNILDILKSKGIIFSEGDYFCPTKFSLTEIQAEEDTPQIKDHPGQLYFDFYER